MLGADRKSSHLIPTWQDIDVLESVNKALGPLQEFTDIMSGEKYVTVSAIKPVLKHLEEKVLVDADADTSLTCDIRRKIKVSLTARYVGTKINELLNVATFLDPRFKLDFTAEKDAASVKLVYNRKLRGCWMRMLNAVKYRVMMSHILQKKSLHHREREGLEKFCRRTRVPSLLKTRP